MYHQAHSGPLMDELKTWMDEQFKQRQVEPNSGLGDAMNYMLKRWDKLTLFRKRSMSGRRTGPIQAKARSMRQGRSMA
jgi:hypothetical protein